MGQCPVRDEAHRRARVLAVPVLIRISPATLVTPAIRPLFAALHGGHEGALHSFMAPDMLGGLLAAPWLAHRADRGTQPGCLAAEGTRLRP